MGGGGGAGRQRSFAICQTAGQIPDPKTALDSPEDALSEYIAKFYLKVTDDVAVHVRRHIFHYLSSLASPGKAAMSYQNKAAETTWIVYGILLSTLLYALYGLVSCQGRPRSRDQKGQA